MTASAHSPARSIDGAWISGRRLSLLVLALSMTLSCVDADTESGSEERVVAPAFSLVQLDGIPVSLADHAGKTIILDFWATWCAPCEVQMPVLDTLWKNRGGEDLMILGVSVDTDPAEKVSAWIAKREIEYPIAIANHELARDYRVFAFPTLVVVDPQGRVHTRHVGVLSRPELEDLLDEIAREAVPQPDPSA